MFVVGVGRDLINLPFMHMSVKGIDSKVQCRYADLCPKVVRLVEGGLVVLQPRATHRHPLEHATEPSRRRQTWIEEASLCALRWPSYIPYTAALTLGELLVFRCSAI